MKIQFEFNGATVVGSLDESAAANEFLAQLPMTVKLEDYGSTEKSPGCRRNCAARILAPH